jgi:hypothetical protein
MDDDCGREGAVAGERPRKARTAKQPFAGHALERVGAPVLQQ